MLIDEKGDSIDDEDVEVEEKRGRGQGYFYTKCNTIITIIITH